MNHPFYSSKFVTRQLRVSHGVLILPSHDDVIKWKQFPRYWPFVRGIHRSSVNSPHKIHWRRALMCSLIWAWINGWVNNCVADDLRRHRAHHNVIVMASRPDNIEVDFVPFSSYFLWYTLGFLPMPHLTHLPLDKMAVILQTIFSDAFLWTKSFVFWLKFHWSLFLGVLV